MSESKVIPAEPKQKNESDSVAKRKTQASDVKAMRVYAEDDSMLLVIDDGLPRRMSYDDARSLAEGILSELRKASGR